MSEGAQVSADVAETDWNTYASGHPDATVDHLWQWREVFTGVFGHECVYLAARRRGSLAGILPLVLFRSRIFGRSVVSVPFLNYGGVLADDAGAAQALIDHATAVGRSFGEAYI